MPLADRGYRGPTADAGEAEVRIKVEAQRRIRRRQLDQVPAGQAIGRPGHDEGPYRSTRKMQHYAHCVVDVSRRAGRARGQPDRRPGGLDRDDLAGEHPGEVDVVATAFQQVAATRGLIEEPRARLRAADALPDQAADRLPGQRAVQVAEHLDGAPLVPDRADRPASRRGHDLVRVGERARDRFFQVQRQAAVEHLPPVGEDPCAGQSRDLPGPLGVGVADGGHLDVVPPRDRLGVPPADPASTNDSRPQHCLGVHPKSRRILPVFPGFARWSNAAVTSAAGNTRSISGSARPAASTGSTERANACTAAAFSSTGRARSTVPRRLARFTIKWFSERLAWAPALCPTMTIRPFTASTRKAVSRFGAPTSSSTTSAPPSSATRAAALSGVTTIAPSFSRLRAVSGDLTFATTRAPAASPSLAPAEPTAPFAPFTRSVSPRPNPH